MPKFEIISQSDAEVQSATGKRAELMREYLGYLELLGPGQAGKLHAGEGETASAVRRRLGAAAKMAGKELVIKRVGEDVLFWVKSTSKAGRRRRGPRKTDASSS